MSEVNPPPQPPVFKDRISPDQAPASIGSTTAEQATQKQQAVIQNYERRAAELSPLVGTQPSPQEVGERVTSANQTVEAAQQRVGQAATAENVVPESGLNKFDFLRRLMGRRSETEQANEVAAANAVLTAAETSRSQSQADLEAAQIYSNDYLAKQSDPNRTQELVEANRRGGPMAVSIEMTNALNRQDQIREQVRFYKERGYDITANKMLPLEVYTGLRALIGKDYHHQEADIEGLIVMMTAANEVALGYADSNGLRIEQQRLTDAYDLGQRITDGVTGSDTRMTYDLVRRKQGREQISTNDAGYYAVGAAQLENFFNRNQIPEGEERVPYVVAYTAGALANGAAQLLGPILRDWLADTLPSERTEMVRKEGEWVEESQPAKPRGLGSFITPKDAYSSWDLQRKGTTDRGLADVMKKAGDIVRSIDRRFRDRRVDYNIIQHFEAQRIEDPRFLNPQTSSPLY